MLRSLYSGISGMQSFQTKLDVIGNNIANVNTVGFKKGRTMFQDLLSQNMSGATAPQNGQFGGVNPRQVGLGVQISSIDTLHTPGSTQLTGVTTDLSIEGDGFFLIMPPNGSVDNPLYTRAGNFTFDANRQLTTSDGNLVVSIVPYMNEDSVLLTADDIFDQLGVTGYDMDESNFTVEDLSANWQSTALAQLPDLDPAFDIDFNEVTDATEQLFVDQSGNVVVSVQAEVSYTDLNGDPQSAVIDTYANVGIVGGDIVAAGGVDPLVANYDHVRTELSHIQLPSEIEAYEISRTGEIIGVTADGEAVGFGYDEAAGEFRIFEGNFTSAVALGFVDNPSGLRKMGGSLYEMTVNANPGADHNISSIMTSGRSSVINSGYLEMSNVDLTEEFTEMIVAQRGFQANSRIITTSDEILQELVNLKR